MLGIVFSFWMKSKPGDVEGHYGYFNWSKPVLASGDAKLPYNKKYGSGLLNWLRKVFYWNKKAVIVPIGYSNYSFVVAYKEAKGDCRVSSEKMKVEDGPFLMRIGPEDIEFFAVSNRECPVSLNIAGYVRGSMKLL